jgi:single-stranded DNA-binding protein
MIRALISGSLFKAPESKTSNNGNAYVSAVMKVSDGNKTSFVRVSAFSDSAREEIEALRDGDGLSVVGTLKAEIYEKGGEARVSLSLTADRALALKKEKRKRDKQRREERKQEQHADSRGGPAPFDDDIAF